jgi:uncharacterized protein (UPF0335 family)
MAGLNVKVYAPEKSNATTCSMDQVRAFVKQIKEKQDEIKGIREDIKELTNDFVDEYGLPKKEVNVAIRMLKSDIDPDIVTEIYANIADLVG